MPRHLLDEVLDARDARGQHDRSRRVSTVTERVERGAALLDEKRPGWWRGIDLNRLNVKSSCDCVAGQLGGYSDTLRALGLLGGEEDVEHGFEAIDPDGDVLAGEYHRLVHEDYAALTDAWRDLITRRRELAQVTG